MSITGFIAPHESLQSETLTISEESREVHLGGQLIELTRTEFNLLSILYRNPRRVLTPEVLLASLWDSDCVPDSHPLEVYIHRLRYKLGESGRYPRFIHNVRGVGYRFDPQPEGDKHRALLRYASRSVLCSVETAESNLWGWDIQEIVGTRFVPTRSSIFRNKQFVNLLNRICEAAEIEDLKLSPTVTRQDGVVVRVHVHMRCRYEGSRLTGMDVDATWFDQDRAEIRSAS